MSFWSEKEVLVTGGAGFIGSHLVPTLVEAGANVSVVDNLERGRKELLAPVLDRIVFHEANLLDDGVASGVTEGKDVVVHLASKVGGIGYYRSRLLEVFEANMCIDGNVLDAALDHDVEYYFYASSAHVYPIELQADAEAPPIKEEQVFPANPELPYGWGKLMGEMRNKFAIAEGRNMRTSIARIIGAYGPNQDTDLATGSAIPVFIRRAVEYPELKPFRLLGTGKETRSYCFVSDVVSGILISIEKLAENQFVGPFNLGAEGRLSIGDLAKTIIDISSKDIEIEFDPSHPTVIWGQALDCTLAHDLLDGWRPEVEMREGLERCYRDIEERLRR